MDVGILEAEENFGVAVVVFDGGGTGDTFELQAPSGGERDYCLVVNGGPTARGGVKRYARNGNKFSFWITEEAATRLGTPSDFYFLVDHEDTTEQHLDHVDRSISEILRGH